MKSNVEQLYKIRRNTMLVLLIGMSLTIVCPPGLSLLFLTTHKIRLGLLNKFHIPHYTMWIFYVTLGLFVLGYLLYKGRILKNPTLKTAVNDERIKTAWLRAYRCAFFALIGITLFWKWRESGFFPQVWDMKLIIPQGFFFVLWGSLIALSGSFLYFSRDVKE